MKAAMYTQYGSPDVIRLLEVDIPTPGEDEVLAIEGKWRDLEGRYTRERVGGT